MKFNLVIFTFLILFSLAIASYTQLPSLTNYYIINDDVRQHTYWTVKFHDHDLFKDDILTEYAVFLSPFGFKAIYYLTTFFAEPIFIGKILSLILYALAGLLFFKIGESIQDRYIGIISFLLFVCFPVHIDRFSGGLHRAFAFPLLAALIYYLGRFEMKKCSVILILQILFYPAIFPVSLLTFIIFMIIYFKKFQNILSKKFMKIYLMFPLMLFLIVLVTKIINKPHFLGGLVSKREMYQNATFYVNGRSPYFPLANILIILKKELLGYKPEFLFLILFLWSCLYLCMKQKNGRLFYYVIVFALFVSSIFLYQIASIFLFFFYIPYRHLDFSLPLLRILITIIGSAFFLNFLNSRFIKFTAAMVVIFIFYLAYGNTIKTGVGCTVIIPKERISMFQYLSQLPKNTLIAANPFLSDDIPIFSKRKVFVNSELAHPWFKGYNAIISKRVIDFYRAYYSESGKEIYDFCRNNGIEFLVIRSSDFYNYTLKNNQFYYEPLNSEISRMVEGKKHFFLMSINKKKMLFQTELKDLYIIKADATTLLN